ncbi:MAG: hypothetical protein ACWA5R_10420, partial [bacterium]
MRNRDSFGDRSHRPKTLRTSRNETQGAIVVELRCSLLLMVDDLLVVVREFIYDKVVQSSLLHLLEHHDVNNIGRKIRLKNHQFIQTIHATQLPFSLDFQQTTKSPAQMNERGFPAKLSRV